MKKIFILIVTLLTNITFGNNWYVSTSSSGNASGNSWTNKVALSSFNWSQVQPGDVVFIDGGSSGLTYTTNLIPTKSGTSGNPITITRGVDAGHDGIPTFTTTGYRSGYFSTDYVIVQYLEFTSTGGSGFEVVEIDGDYITFQYNTVLAPRLKCIRMDANNGCKILHNILDTGTSNPSGASPDGIWLGNNGRNLEIAYNQILQRNSDPGNGSHKDVIQSYGWQSTSQGGLTKIHHNFMWNASATTTSNSIFELGGLGGDWEIYDNIVVYGGQGSGRIFYMGNCGEDPYTSYPFSAQVYNNTFVVVDATYYGVSFDNTDSLWFKNNIVYNPNGLYNMLVLGTVTTAHYMSFDYNQYTEGTNGSWLYNWVCNGNANGYSFSQWRSNFGQDAHSENFTSTTAIKFTGASLRSTDPADFKLQATSTGVDEGTTIGLFSDDYSGASRPVGAAWDAGAFEFGGTQSNNINVKAKIFLQGPFSSNSMLTTLNQGSYLPISQPYNAPPWNYSGTENLGSGPNTTMVDWVLVELRNAANPSQVVARRAAVLKNNGLLLETDGSEGVVFNNTAPGSYYIAIYHRNHLAIMSAGSVSLSSNSTLYDFTTAMNKAYGQNPMVQLASGVFGMYASDGNGDGVIDLTDRDSIWLIENGSMGYLEGDFNMNSGVTVHDVNQFWNVNNGKMSQLPQ
jgi:hypothetical protein